MPTTVVKASMFLLIRLIYFPITCVGVILFSIKLMFSRHTGVSLTALSPLYMRWMQHQMGTRLDEPGVKLMMALPIVSPVALRIVTGGTLLAHRLIGYIPAVYRLPYAGGSQMAYEPAARTIFFDAALRRHLNDIEQFVLLGAGFDTRSYQIPQAIRCFEIDAPKTQEIKRQMLKKAGLDTTRITFVSADFMTENWLENLKNAGFDENRPTFFLWEGVMMYLDREAVEYTLRNIASTASGSIVAFDYFNADLLNARGPYMRFAHSVVNLISEPFRFGIEISTPASKSMTEFLSSFGMLLEEQQNFGAEATKKAAAAGFASALVP